MSDNSNGGARPLRASWRDFPAEYIAALRTAHADGSVRLGPMSWSDARFAQREFYRLVSALRRTAADDPEAAILDDIARRLRVSCPRTDEDLTQHWFVLRANPIVAGMQDR